MAAIEQRYDRVADLARGFAKLWIAGVVGLNVVVGVAALVAGPTVLEGCLQAVARYSPSNPETWALNLALILPALGANWLARARQKGS